MKRKTDKSYRTRAISVVRGELRHQGRVPQRVSGKDAFVVLDEIGRGGQGEVSEWFLQASEASLDRWVREWDAWARVELDCDNFKYRAGGG